MHSAILLIAFAVTGAADAATAPKPYDEQLTRLVEESRTAWSEFLSKKLTHESSEADVRKLMEGRYRDFCRNDLIDDDYLLIYLVDEFHQITFSFHYDFKKQPRLTLPPLIEPKRLWLRNPEGRVVLVRTREEYAAKMKAQDAALKYVANKTANPIKIHMADRINDGKWDIVVVVDLNEFDPAKYKLIVNDDGEVQEKQ